MSMPLHIDIDKRLQLQKRLIIHKLCQEAVLGRISGLRGSSSLASKNLHTSGL
jgi:hypothetical protein